MSLVYEDWAARYGPVFEVPLAFGRKKVVLTDPKALVHFYSSERAVYVKTETDRLFIGKIVRDFCLIHPGAANRLGSSGVGFYGQKEICTSGAPQPSRHGL
jgi:hypothetical protein